MNKVKALVAAGVLLTSVTAYANPGTPVNTKPRSYENHSDFKLGVGFDQGFGINAELYDTIDAFIGNDGVSADYQVVKDKRFAPNLPFTYYVAVGGFYDFNKTWHGDHGHWVSHPYASAHNYCDSFDKNGNCHHWHNGYRDEGNGYYGYWEENESNHFNDYGIRVPLGLDWQFAPQWDGFASLAPRVNIPDSFHFGVDAALGVRYAF
ncbi:hypothetical protein [Vibrio sp. B1Z05]|uniref:hypothetical protein n=1 Tax=Vibrio sp. B1Z05 TaxID=2654980 RepID=UPI00128B881B|nr:hypothetical protein [Vibrio sp. B1Z05]MPW35871.1 hypothetical protein [Vibrio sp. B1Z05]